MNTIRTEPTFVFLTSKINAGKEFEFNLINFMIDLGYSPSKIKVYQEITNYYGGKIASFIFMTKELGLTPLETTLLSLPLTKNLTSYVYKKLYIGVRLNSGDKVGFNNYLRENTLNIESIKEVYRKFGV